MRDPEEILRAMGATDLIELDAPGVFMCSANQCDCGDPATAYCDYRIKERTAEWQTPDDYTCSAPLCDACRIRWFGGIDKDLCPYHAGVAEQHNLSVAAGEAIRERAAKKAARRPRLRLVKPRRRRE